MLDQADRQVLRAQPLALRSTRPRLLRQVVLLVAPALLEREPSVRRWALRALRIHRPQDSRLLGPELRTIRRPRQPPLACPPAASVLRPELRGIPVQVRRIIPQPRRQPQACHPVESVRQRGLREIPVRRIQCPARELPEHQREPARLPASQVRAVRALLVVPVKAEFLRIRNRQPAPPSSRPNRS